MIDDKDFPDDYDFPGWMRLGKADCGWSNIAADETSPRYLREDIVNATIAEETRMLLDRVRMLEAENNRLRRRTEFKW
jgi:hypothetical protein